MENFREISKETKKNDLTRTESNNGAYVVETFAGPGRLEHIREIQGWVT